MTHAQIVRIQERQDTSGKKAARTTKRGRTISEHAAAAKMIRQDLKKAWPSFKFSVTSESFSMGDAVNISWTDGPTTEEVEQIVKKYQYGTFDGMEDIYNNTNTRQDFPQTKFVQCHRRISQGIKEAAAALIASRGGNLSPWDIQNMTHRMTYGQSFVCNKCQHPAQLGDKFCEECGGPIAHNENYW